MKITLDNVVETLFRDDTITLNYIYSYKSCKFWSLDKPITIVLSNNEEVTIPKGFTTDLCTVPKFLWSQFAPFGDFVLASILHDYLYINKDKHSMDQKQVDKEMLIWSKTLNSNNFDNYVRYYCVRLFGWLYWKGIIHYNTSRK